MRKVIPILIAVLMIATPRLFADERTFGAGSLIIPMDSQTQNTIDDGIFLAYGLVYQLLGQGFTVYSVIDEEKTANTDPDLIVKADATVRTVVNGSAYLPTPATMIPYEYLGGPFMIDASEASAVKALVAALSPEFDTVVIHEFNEPVTCSIGATYDEVPKKIALLSSVDPTTNEDYTDSVMVCYMDLAGIPVENYDILSTQNVIDGQLVVGTYYILWMPHWKLSDQPDLADGKLVVQRIKEFLDAGGNVMATCKAIDAIEYDNTAMTSESLGINGTGLGDTLYRHHDIPFAQIGDYPFSVDETLDTQSFRNYQSGDTASTDASSSVNSTWLTNTSLIALAADLDGNVPPHPWGYYAQRAKDNDVNKGNMHFIAGHQYASCKPTIVPGQTYRMATTMSSCKKGNGKTAFWDNATPCIKITLRYTGGDGSISLELCKGDFKEVVGNEFRIWTEDPNADPNRPGTNYGPGCQGAGSPSGTDHLDGIFIQNLTTNDNIIINTIEVEWDCDGDFDGDPDCADSYQFEQFDIKIDNGNCGNASCDQCTDVTPNGKFCESDGTYAFSPTAKGNDDLTFDGSILTGGVGGTPSAGNVGGLRYIYNTLFNKIVNPITVAEFARSGPVVLDRRIVDAEGNVTEKTMVYFGTFEYPDNAGHFRAYEASGTGSDLTEVWDAANGIPSFTERNLFTFINGAKVLVKPENAAAINAYVADPLLTTQDTEENIKTLQGRFRFKRMGGVERSTAAIVTKSSRVNANRKEYAYFGTTYGVLQMIDLDNGTEYGGYVPAALLQRLPYTDVNDPNRPKVDASPTVLDTYMRKTDDGIERSWATILLTAHGTAGAGISALDISDPQNISLQWEKFNTAANPDMYGYSQRASVAKYRRDIDPDDPSPYEQTLDYVALVSSNLPSNANNDSGLRISAYRLKNGNNLWTPIDIVHPDPVSNQNDIPAPVAAWDSDADGFEDQIFVGDLAGRLWQLDLDNGSVKKPPHANEGDPFYNTLAGTSPAGEARPIAATPSLGYFNGKAVVAFGTGGTDWSAATNNFVLVQDLNTGDELLKINIGALKVYSPVVIAGDRIFFTAVDGTLGSPNPTLDIVDGETSYLYSAYISDAGTVQSSRTVVEKSRGSVYVKNGQTFSGGMKGTLNRFGTKQEQDSSDQLIQLLWKDLTNAPKALEEQKTEADGSSGQ